KAAAEKAAQDKPAEGEKAPDISSGIWKVGKPSPSRKISREELEKAAAAAAPPAAPTPVPDPAKSGAVPRPGDAGAEESDLVRVRASKLGQLDGLVSELSLAR